jgi:hypothetical protein
LDLQCPQFLMRQPFPWQALLIFHRHLRGASPRIMWCLLNPSRFKQFINLVSLA